MVLPVYDIHHTYGVEMAVDDSYTKSLLHFDGADGSNTFTDESGKTWTAHGNAQIDTAQSKFGGASGLFDGTGDYIDTPDHADWSMGSNDFTVDFWIRRNAINARQWVFGNMDSSSYFTTASFGAGIQADNKVEIIVVRDNSTLVQPISSGTITSTSAWNHIAIVRYGNTVTLYINGVADGTGDVTGWTVKDSSSKFTIGRPGEYNGLYWNGWIDEFRISKGIARWTSNFTPPSKAYAPLVISSGTQIIII